MKNNTLYAACCLLLVLMIAGRNSSAQVLSSIAATVVDTGNVRATINSNGILFEKFITSSGNNLTNIEAGFEAPKDSGVNAIFGSAFWIAGLDDGNQLHTAASTYRQFGDDFFPGPVDVSGNAASIAAWDKLWKVGKTEIEYHKLHFSDAGYVIPASIAEWPGNGPAGFDNIMAPFADLNSNGVYEPALGDYPVILGDQAVYFIANDKALPHTESNGLPLGIEIHGMAYEFSEATNPELSNSVFLNLVIKNKSADNYHNLYFGLWNDYDLGCYVDDYFGTDVAKNSVFAINADSIDGVACSDSYYGADPPAIIATFLSHPLTNSMIYYNDFSQLGNPEGTAANFYNYLQSIWLDGSPLAVDSLHNNGYGGTDTTNYAYPGFSDSSANGQPSNWWWDTTPTPADSRIIGSSGPIDLPSQGVISFDAAYIFSPHNGADENGEGRLALSDYVQIIIDLYNSGQITGVDQPTVQTAEVKVYPNPFRDFTTISFNGKFESMQLMDITGRLILNQRLTNSSSITLNRNQLPDGVYLLQLSSQQQQFTTRIIVQ